MTEEHCGDDNCLCHGDRRHETGWCEPPFPTAANSEWTCPECGDVSVSFQLDDGTLPDWQLRILTEHGQEPSEMFGWRRTGVK